MILVQGDLDYDLDSDQYSNLRITAMHCRPTGYAAIRVLPVRLFVPSHNSKTRPKNVKKRKKCRSNWCANFPYKKVKGQGLC